jgi:hypothetical protein
MGRWPGRSTAGRGSDRGPSRRWPRRPQPLAAVRQGGLVSSARPTMAMRATSEMKGALPRWPGQPRRADAGSPASRARRRCCRAGHATRRSRAGREQLQQSSADSQDGPCGGGNLPATRPHRDRVGCHNRGGRPRREGQDSVEECGPRRVAQYDTGGTGDRRGMFRGEAAQPLAEPPDSERPGQGPTIAGFTRQGSRNPIPGRTEPGEPGVQRCWVPGDEDAKKSVGRRPRRSLQAHRQSCGYQRMSRVPWNFGGGPIIIRLRSRFHHDGRHRQSARRHAAAGRVAALAGAGGR